MKFIAMVCLYTNFSSAIKRDGSIIFFFSLSSFPKKQCSRNFKENSFGQGTQIILDFVCVKFFFSDLKNKKTKIFLELFIVQFSEQKTTFGAKYQTLTLKIDVRRFSVFRFQSKCTSGIIQSFKGGSFFLFLLNFIFPIFRHFEKLTGKN